MPNFKTPVGRVIAEKATLWELQDGNHYKVKPAHCQREYCWRPEQYQAFIQHAVDASTIGEIIVIIENHRTLHIVDGQHRLKAIADFKNDVFPIKDVDTGKEWFYSQLDNWEQHDIDTILCYIRRIHVKEYDPVLAKKIYDGYNFGGVRH
jgi:hypothetical protein